MSVDVYKRQEGFSRVRIDGEIVKLDGEPRTLNKKIKHFIDVVVDRVQLKESATSRIAEMCIRDSRRPSKS